MIAKNYADIANAVGPEIDRLFPSSDYVGNSRQKAQNILSALHRLKLAVRAADPNASQTPAIQTIDPNRVSLINLSSLDNMLDAEIYTWEGEIEPSLEHGMEFNGRKAGYVRRISLRMALNIDTQNPFNVGGSGTWGSLLLGRKATALMNVESRLAKRTPVYHPPSSNEPFVTKNTK